jgi:hypothetical protein
MCKICSSPLVRSAAPLTSNMWTLTSSTTYVGAQLRVPDVSIDPGPGLPGELPSSRL